MQLKHWNKTSQKLMKKQKRMKLIRQNKRILKVIKKQREKVYRQNLID